MPIKLLIRNQSRLGRTFYKNSINKCDLSNLKTCMLTGGFASFQQIHIYTWRHKLRWAIHGHLTLWLLNQKNTPINSRWSFIVKLCAQIIISWKRIIISCERFIISSAWILIPFARIIKSSAQIIISCARIIISCKRIIISCAWIIISCKRIIISCARIIISCPWIIIPCTRINKLCSWIVF